MAKQKHDPGVIKRKTAMAPYSKEKIWRERRKRALPFLYPGWEEDHSSVQDVKIALKRRKKSED